ncbi:MAG: MBL fold metallo-hydrolase [Ignavibacteria bacterium]|nr:MBL fold metallo-hydrolase [Ignavibacteria bacterium]
MKVFQIPVTPFAMNCYIYFDENTKEGVIFDPAAYIPDEENQIKKIIEDNGIKIKYIINTHGHIDHIMGNKFAKDYFNVPILMHEKDMPFYKNILKQGAMYGLDVIEPPPVDEFIDENSKIKVGDVEFKILHTPGHSPGSLTFIDDTNKNIFCGDVIFKDSIGRTDLMFGDYDELMNSINNVLLPTVQDDYTLHPGHMEITTVGREKEHNPFL